MKKYLALMSIIFLSFSCEQQEKKSDVEVVEPKTAEDPTSENSVGKANLSAKERAEALKQQGHQVFLYEEGDTTYLMQQYFIVFLKSGDIRDQDSLQTARLMEQHLAHLTRMAEEGFSSLTGPMGDNGELRGIVIYNTSTLKEADSLAHLDPMVKSGRLKVEVRPWWTAKGGQLP